ncbi:thiamine phosphate synthase [Brevibacillus fulvus]|uniref:Thiamine-phosphate synthase n=1 Tax=Brevibacillus fulvus TaxID=1125967 RepID=A0A938XZ24_9BACL|nr:thiamine phosphate synthase [Brevibacillus fulvus]MBM7590426.1 thiamine-phosphate pyrophosphorylase [Brevibacillus fulvus]
MKQRDSLRQKLQVYLVIGSQDCDFSAEKTLQITGEALAGGVGLVQFRDKGSRLSESERIQLARQMQALCREHNALFFVNDDVQLAVDLKADGIHVGQDDMPLSEVKKLVGDNCLIGVSAGTVSEAVAAQQGGADYLGVGAMYATASKPDAGEPIGPNGLADIRRAVGERLPIVGIGGIHLGNAASVLQAGADGIAVISAITRAESPRQAARTLSAEVRSQLQQIEAQTR